VVVENLSKSHWVQDVAVVVGGAVATRNCQVVNQDVTGKVVLVSRHGTEIVVVVPFQWVAYYQNYNIGVLPMENHTGNIVAFQEYMGRVTCLVVVVVVVVMWVLVVLLNFVA